MRLWTEGEIQGLRAKGWGEERIGQLTGHDGRFDALIAGQIRVHLWHPGMREEAARRKAQLLKELARYAAELERHDARLRGERRNAPGARAVRHTGVGGKRTKPKPVYDDRLEYF